MSKARSNSSPAPRGPAPRFLITRLSALGDCVQTLPLACALKDRWPACHISWAAHPSNARLLTGHACIDRVISVPHGYLLRPRLLAEVRRHVRAAECEIALDPQSLLKSSALGWLAGCRRRIGFAAPQGRELAPWLNNERVEPQSTHMVNRYLELLQPLGIDQPQVRFAVPVIAEGAAAINRFLTAAHLHCPFAAINPGAGWPSKLWPAERFARLAKSLGQKCNLPTVVLWSGTAELAAAESIVAAAGGYAVLAPATNLPELAALLRQARVMVSADTGPLHLAAAVGTRCVGLFGTTRHEICGPYGPGHLCLQAWYQTGPCRERRSAANLAMQDIEVEQVFEACRTLLTEAGPGHSRVA